MKKSMLLSLGLLAVVGCVAASTASAADPLTKKVTALQRQFNAQQKELNALNSSVKTLRDQVAESGGAALTGQVSTLQTSVTALQGQVNTLGATLTCRVAQFGTFDYTVTDLFALMLDQPPAFTGQVVPDNGACAQVGLTPPSPAADRYVDPTNPVSVDLALDANLLAITQH